MNQAAKASGSAKHWLCTAAALIALSASAAAQDALFIDNQGRVGMGTATPSQAVHVHRDDGTAQILVQETAGTAATRTLFALENPGNVLFTLKDTNTGDIWDFSNRVNGFNITRQGTGGQEFLIQPNGRFIVGPGGQHNFIVHPNGDAVLAGTLTESSSRETKTAIQPVDGEQVLAKLAALPLSEWQYKDSTDRHMGPMAEDFHAAYGLADDKHVSPKDMAGVAMVAAQSLQRIVKEQQHRILELEAQLAALQTRNTELEELEARLDRIELQMPQQVAFRP